MPSRSSSFESGMDEDADLNDYESLCKGLKAERRFQRPDGLWAVEMSYRGETYSQLFDDITPVIAHGLDIWIMNNCSGQHWYYDWKDNLVIMTSEEDSMIVRLSF